MRLSDRIRIPLPRGRDRPDAEAFFDWITLYLCFLPCSVVPIPHRVYISTCSHEVSVPQQAGAGHNKSLWSFVPHCSAWCARCDALDVINPEVTAHLASRARSSSQYGALPFLGIHAESMHTAREHETRREDWRTGQRPHCRVVALFTFPRTLRYISTPHTSKCYLLYRPPPAVVRVPFQLATQELPPLSKP